MTESTVISIDCMGGDHGPSVVVPGVAKAAERLEGRGIRFLLHGDEAQIRSCLAKQSRAAALCDVRHTDLVIAMDEKPVEALRKKRDNSISRSWGLMASGEVKAVVSAGHTGAMVASALFNAKMFLPGVRRPGIGNGKGNGWRGGSTIPGDPL